MLLFLVSAKKGDKTCNRTNSNEIGCHVKNGAYFLFLQYCAY